VKDKNFALLVLAFLVIGFNAAIPMVFGAFSIRTMEPGNTLYLALLFVIPSLAAFVGQNYWGSLCDISGQYKPYLVISFLASALAFLLLTFAQSGLQFIVLLGVATFFSVALLPIGQAYATVAHESEKGRVLGHLFAFESVGWGLACLMGASSWANEPGLTFVNRLFFLALGLSLAMAVALIVWFDAPPRRKRKSVPGRSGFRAVAAELLTLYKDRRILSMAAVLFCLTIGTLIFFSMYTSYLCFHLAGSKSLLGLSLAGATLVGAVSFPLYGRLSDRCGRTQLILLATGGYILLYFSFIFIKNPLILALLYAIPLYPAIRVATNAFLADLTDQAVRGGGLGLIEGVQAISSAIAPLLAAAVVERGGLGVLPVAAFVVMLASGGMVVGVLKLQRVTA